MEIINVTDEIIEINVTEAVVNVVTQNGAYPLPSNVFSVFGRVGNVVGQAGDYTTSIVAEGTNLYYTQARFNTAFGNKTTTDLTEGTNLYYTNARSRAAISENITGLEYSSASGIFSLASGYVIPTQASLDAKVPYTGATGNVTLGEHQLTAGQIAFDQTPTGTAGVGVLRWNDNDGTLDLGLKGGNVTLQVGQEMLVRVVNKTGADLLEANYQVVRISSAQGQRVAVQLAQANNDANSTDTIGIVTETIQNNQEGFITILGQVKEINTTGSLQGETWADGDVLYLSPTTAGRITNIKPTAPQHMVAVGYVEYAHSQHGKIFTKIQNGYELEELHDVAAIPYIDKGVLYRDTATNLWKSATIGTLLGYTPVTSARTISTTAPLTGGGDLSANRTLAITQSSASADGYLSSTDWSTFNNKQPLIAAGTTAQYYRGDKTFQTLDTLAVPENTNLYYTQARFDTAFGNKSTTNLAEGTNLYYTDARARAAITGTAPIDVSGGVVSISQASGSSNGYLSSTDWNTFNNKQAALNGTGFVKISGTTISYDANTYLTTISGIAAGGELSGTYPNPTLVNSAVTGKVLTGLNLTGGGTIADTDSILGAFGKVQNQISALVGGVMYEGTWNASTNTPTIVSSVGSKGDYYIVATAGSTNINGITSWNIGDWIIFNGTTWDKVDNTDAVSSVNGYTGAVSLVTSDVPESGSLYFTNARAIGSTLTGYTSGAGVVAATDTILQAIQKLNGNVSGLVTGVSSVFGRTGAVVAANGDYNTSQVTENTNLYYTEARVSANTDVAANTAARHAAVTIGTANGLSLSTQALSLAAASTSTTGALTSTDWNTFNNKQAALNGTGFVKISGTTISYDNSTYLTTSSASATYLPLSGGTLTGALSGTSATFSNAITANGAYTNTSDVAIIVNAAIPAINLRTSGNIGRFTLASGYSNENRTSFIVGTGSSNPSIEALRIEHSTGAATFSSKLTTTGPANDWGLVVNGSGTLGQSYGANIRGGSNSSDVAFLVSNYVGGDILRILGNGNVGIGTSSPTARLHVYDAGNNFSTAIGGIGGAQIVAIGNASGIASIQGFSNNAFAAYSNLSLNAGGGNVGIGTSSPQTTLEVLGPNVAEYLRVGGGTISERSLRFSSFDVSGLSGVGHRINAPHSSGTIAFDTNSTERMRITSGGNVGIGTSSPTDYGSPYRTLEFNAPSFPVFNMSSGGTRQFQIVASSTESLIATVNATPLLFYTNGTERMRITSGGNVGIGTSSPANPISFVRVLNISGGDAALVLSNTNGTAKNWSIGALDSGSLSFWDGGNERMRITSGGNVLINNTDGDNSALIINGFNSVVGTAIFKNSNKGTNASHIHYDTNGDWYIRPANNSGSVYVKNYVAESDLRLKDNIQDINYGLSEILNLTPRMFNWKQSNNEINGFIAQEVEQVIPALVFEGQYKSVDYQGLTAILVKAIQEQQAQIDELKAKILSL